MNASNKLKHQRGSRRLLQLPPKGATPDSETVAWTRGYVAACAFFARWNNTMKPRDALSAAGLTLARVRACDVFPEDLKELRGQFPSSRTKRRS